MFPLWQKFPWIPALKRLMLLPSSQRLDLGVEFLTGTGAPTAIANNGSIYFRTDGAAGTTLYLRVGGAWVAVPAVGGPGSFTTLAASGVVTFTNQMTVSGEATLSGDLTIGAGTGNQVNIRSRLASSLVPVTTNLYDLGSTSLRFAAGWFTGAVTATGGFVGALTGNADTATKLASSSYFTSTEQTGTGANQNIAHGLGVTPSAWIIQATDGSALVGPPSFNRVSANSTNVVVNVTSAAKFVIIAFK